MVYVELLFLLLAVCSIFICVWYHFRAFKKQSLLPRWQGQPKSLVIIPVTQKVLAEGNGQDTQFDSSSVIGILRTAYASIIGLENIACKIEDGPRNSSPKTQQASLMLVQLELIFAKRTFSVCRVRVEVKFQRSKSIGIRGIYEVLEKCEAKLNCVAKKLSHNDDCLAQIENIKQELEGLEISGMNIKEELEGLEMEGLGNGWGLKTPIVRNSEQ